MNRTAESLPNRRQSVYDQSMHSESRMIVDALLSAYRRGAFPMADSVDGPVGFYHAPVRGVFPMIEDDALGEFHVPRRLRRKLESNWFDLRCDTDFAGVVRGCAEPRIDDPDTWINREIQEWFQLLFDAGHAHSVEAWRHDPATGRDVLVGGIYGLAIGGAFCGESMFSRPRPRLENGERDPLDGTDASKVCLVRLVEHLKRQGFVLFDTQLLNPHLAQFGCVEISHDEYMERLTWALEAPAAWGEFGN